MATLMSSFTLESGKLIIRNDEAHLSPIVAGFGGVPVHKVLPLLSGNRCLVLLDPGFSRTPTFENLLCIDSTGGIAWKARLTKSHDAFVDVLLTKAGIEARTWNGWEVAIDAATGASRVIGCIK